VLAKRPGERLLDRALAADPQNFKVILAQSLQISDLGGAREILLDAAGTVSRPAELYYYSAMNLRWTRQFERAQIANERAIAAQPFWRTYVNQADIEYVRTADPAKIDAWLDKVSRDQTGRTARGPHAALMRLGCGVMATTAIRVLTSLAPDYLEDNFFTGRKRICSPKRMSWMASRGGQSNNGKLAERPIR